MISGTLMRDLKTLRLMVFDFDGVFTDNRVYVSEDGRETVACWRSDGLGLAGVRRAGIPLQVISTEKNPVVSVRCKKLGIECIQGCDDKLAALKQLMDRHGINKENVMFTGNDTNDSECLEFVGLPVVVADAHPSVFKHARYVTTKKGGYGAVREICDLVTAALGEKEDD